MSAVLGMFFYLLMGHAMGDFVLQSEVMAKSKNPHIPARISNMPTWYYWLTAHAMCHGFFVTIITGSVGLGFLETCMHWTIDYAKMDGLYGKHVDQFLHVLCKVGWIVLWKDGIR